ncbi:hypothetical protein [Vreelandella venusta]|uniref:hypothetical protein n=1 Tax=Vreelandella venusta TaxID=44935 RepID=UPI003AA7D664
MTQREKFEEFVNSKGQPLTRNGDRYLSFATQFAWEAWQAALPWTNVEDGLPDNSFPVIANDGHDSYCAAYAGRWLDLEVTDRAGDYWPLDNVKRWMPLPE